MRTWGLIMLIVTGIGPRCGTSFMTRLLANSAGVEPFGERFPWYAVPEGNPAGYWEADLSEPDIRAALLDASGPVVAKVWPRFLVGMPFDVVEGLVVCRRRDRGAQIESINRLLAMERAAGIDEATGLDVAPAATMIDHAEWIVSSYIGALRMMGSRAPIRVVHTEDMEVFRCQQLSEAPSP